MGPLLSDSLRAGPRGRLGVCERTGALNFHMEEKRSRDPAGSFRARSASHRGGPTLAQVPEPLLVHRGMLTLWRAGSLSGRAHRRRPRAPVLPACRGRGTLTSPRGAMTEPEPRPGNTAPAPCVSKSPGPRQQGALRVVPGPCSSGCRRWSGAGRASSSFSGSRFRPPTETGMEQSSHPHAGTARGFVPRAAAAEGT